MAVQAASNVDFSFERLIFMSEGISINNKYNYLSIVCFSCL